MLQRRRRYDAVDLDPCGSVAELLPTAVSCLVDGGLLCATATDLGALSGRFGDGASARYESQPLRCSPKVAPEMAVRTLLACAQRAAAAEGRRAEPLLAIAVAGFYCRVVVRITDDVSSPPPPIGFVVACTACGAAVAEPPGRAAPLVCAQCGGSELERGGPVWLGPTASAPFVRALVGACRRPGAALPSLATLEPLLEAAAAEAELGARAPLPIPLPAACRLLGCRPLPLERAIEALRRRGHSAAAAHWDPSALQVEEGGLEGAWAVLRAWAAFAGPAEGGGGDSAAAAATRERLLRRGGEPLDPQALGFDAPSALRELKRRVGGDDGGVADAPKRARRDAAPPNWPVLPAAGADSCERCAGDDAVAAPTAAAAAAAVVVPGGEGDEAAAADDGGARRFSDLAAAVRWAPAGSSVVVRAGAHVLREAAVVRRSLSIVGEGGARIVRRGGGSVVVVEAPADAEVSVSGLTLAQMPAAGEAAPADDAGYAVVVRGGVVQMRGVTLSSATSGCLFVSASARVALRGCTLREARAHGALASGTSELALHHCLLYRLGAAGVEARGRSRVRLCGTRVHQAARSALFAAGASDLAAARCDIAGAGCAGVEAAAQAEVRLTDSVVRASKKGGVLLLGAARAEIVGCALRQSSMAGLTVRGAARAELHESVVCGGRTSGVYVCERGTALLVRNTIADNGLAGVEVGAGGAVEAEENVLEGNAEAWVGAAAAVRTVT
jgi:tRNA G26 N,N-dimethylase Trm1/nitrous oxidase accessory protein NosD